MAPVLLPKELASDKKLVNKLLRMGLSVQIVREQPSRFDR
jgi:hypothetical protein